jgi:hypothetical protein
MSYKFNPFTGTFDDVGPNNGEGVPGGSNTQVQYNDNGVFGGSADLTWDDSAKELGVGGDINLDDGGTYETTVQVVTPTANRTISFPDATGTVALVAGSSGQLTYNDAGAQAGVTGSTVDGSGNVTLTSVSTGLGTAGAPTHSFTGDPNTGIYSPGADQVAISTNGTGRLFVDASGNVGIGQASVTAVFGRTVSNTGAAAATYRVAGNSTSAYLFTSDGLGYGGINQQTNHPFTFGTNGLERMRITSDGKLGLGTSSPGSVMHVKGANIRLEEAAGGRTLDIYPAISGTDHRFTSTTTGAGYSFENNTGTLVAIKSDGNVGIGTTSPAYQCVVEGSTPYLQLKQAGTNTGSSRVIFGDADTASPGQIIYDHSNSSLQAVVNGTERARIDSSGRLLVGTSSSTTQGNITGDIQIGKAGGCGFGMSRWTDNAFAPIINLGKSRGASVGSNAVVQSGDELGRIEFSGDDGTDLVSIGANIFAAVDGTPGANDMPGRLVFSTTADGASVPTERMRIDSSGTVLIGVNTKIIAKTTNPFVFFQAQATTTTSGLTIESYGNNIATRYHFGFTNPNGVVGTISTNGSATAYNTSSDYRLKENIVPLTGAADRLNQLQVHRFNFIADPDKTVDGFLAHEAQAIVPECVTGTKDEVDADGNPVYQGIDQSKLVPLLTAALQEALQKIEDLEGRLTAAGI